MFIGKLVRCCVAVLGLASPALFAEVLVRVGPELAVNSFTTNHQLKPAVAAASDGDFVVAWQSLYQDGNNWGVFARRFDSAGGALAGEFAVNAFTSGYQDRKGITVDGAGNFVIVWGSSNQDGSSASVFARRYDSAGSPLAAELQVNVVTQGIQHVPTVAGEANGDFVVSWRSNSQDGSNYGVFARLFDSSGVAKTSEFQVNSYTAGQQFYQAIASDADGDFVIAWESAGQDGAGNGVFARRFNSSGAALAAEFQVSSHTLGTEDRPAIASDADGDFVIAWTSSIRDGSGSGVFARRYDSAGSAQAVELQVNQATLSNQDDASVAVDGDGDFVIAWSSSGQDASDSAVLARSFNAAGVPRTNEFRINTVETGRQDVPAVAFQGDGAAVIVWESETGDASNTNIRAQRLKLAVALDVDGNGTTDALTDGLLFLRFGFGFTGATLIGGATAVNCTRCDAVAIAAYLAALNLILDVDGDGEVGALTDSLLVLRFLFGFTGSTLTGGAVDADCSRCDAAAIGPFLQILDG